MSQVPPVVCAIDDRYSGTLCVLMESLAAAHGPALPSLRMVVLHSGLRDESRRLIQRYAQNLGLPLELRTVPPAPSRFPVSDWVSDAVYLRLSVGEALPDHTMALYLDADVLVLDDIRDLLNTSLDGELLGAVRDPLQPAIGRGTSLPGWRELGLPEDRDYFNSGVLLLDLEACRTADLFDRCRRFLADCPHHVRFWDQDALNWAVDDRWSRLDRRWNTFPLSALSRMPGFEHYAEDIFPVRQLIAEEDSATILHFAGSKKPWRPEYPSGSALETFRTFAAAYAVRKARMRRSAASDAGSSDGSG